MDPLTFNSFVVDVDWDPMLFVGPSHGPISGPKRQTQRRQRSLAEPELQLLSFGKSDCHVGLYVNWATRPASLGWPLADLLFCMVASVHVWYWDVTATLCLGSCQRPGWGCRISLASPGLDCMEHYQVPLPPGRCPTDWLMYQTPTMDGIGSFVNQLVGTRKPCPVLGFNVPHERPTSVVSFAVGRHV